MTETQTYRKRGIICAVKLDLDMEPLQYRKWGGVQTAKPGDWAVLSNGDTYTIDAAEFDKTYVEVSPGVFRKTAITYAYELNHPGSLPTLEGTSDYLKGDFLCAPNSEMTESYPVSRDTFLATYERVDA